VSLFLFALYEADVFCSAVQAKVSTTPAIYPTINPNFNENLRLQYL